MGAPASKDLGAIEDGDAAATPVRWAHKPRPRAALVARGACDEGRVSLVLPFAADAAVTVGQDQPIIQGQQVDGACYLATPPPDPAASVARPQHARSSAFANVEPAQCVGGSSSRNLANPTSRSGAAQFGRLPIVGEPRRQSGPYPRETSAGRKATMKLTTPRASYRLNRGRPASLGQEAKRPTPSVAHSFWHAPDPVL